MAEKLRDSRLTCIHRHYRSRKERKRRAGYCKIKKISLTSDKSCEGCKDYKPLIDMRKAIRNLGKKVLENE